MISGPWNPGFQDSRNALELANFDWFCLFVCLFLWTPSFEGNWVSLMGFRLTSMAGPDGNAPYQAQELQITTWPILGYK